MPHLKWKEIDGELVTCADCEFYPDCQDIEEGLEPCEEFLKKGKE